MSDLGVFSAGESDDMTSVYYVADAPRRRDVFRVLSGRWRPQVRRVERMTSKALMLEVKSAWTAKAIQEQFYDDAWMMPGLTSHETEHKGPDTAC